LLACVRGRLPNRGVIHHLLTGISWQTSYWRQGTERTGDDEV
jgi:hypothetical protein